MDEREKFEIVMRCKGLSIARALPEYGGAYRSVEDQWRGWQSRAALAAPSLGIDAPERQAVEEAVDILTASADSLRECHTLSDNPNDWRGEDDAKAEYDRILHCVAALRRHPEAKQDAGP